MSHFIGKETRLKPSLCLSCGKLLDASTGVDHNKPRADMITICLYCGHLMAFTDDLSMRELTGEEMNGIAGNPTVLAIQKARGYVMAGKQSS